LDTSIPLVFLGIFAIGFLGSLPVNPINLCALDIGLRRSALPFSLGAALIETGQSAVALLFGQWAGQLLETNPVVKVVGALFALALGVFYLVRKKKADGQLVPGANRIFFYGLMVGFMNPQAMAFWILVLSSWNTWEVPALSFDAAPLILLFFLLGVGSAKLAALQTYAVLGKRVSGRFGTFLSGNALHQVIGLLLIGLGLVQLIP
jgi:threonine/homoserine/homoserine lactone efflux protein